MNGPACPICGAPTTLCEPSHEKPFYACRRTHEEPGIVLRAQDVDYAFTLARARLMDKFDEHGVQRFSEVEKPGDVPGLATARLLDHLETVLNHKQMRDRKKHHDDEAYRQSTTIEPDQANLSGWSG